MVLRVYVEKRPEFDVEAPSLLAELRGFCGVSTLKSLRVIKRYDCEGISQEVFAACTRTVFSEPQTDDIYRELPELADTSDRDLRVLAVEYLPGQFDQRANSAAECIQLITQGERPTVRSCTIYLFAGELTDADMDVIKTYLINPVEAREASLELPSTLAQDIPEPAPVEVLNGFLELDEAGLLAFLQERELAMDLADLRFTQDYFVQEKRPPTITEIKMLDTYWSDHCRHTTFTTHLDQLQFDDARVQESFDRYIQLRQELGRSDAPVTLMDVATIAARSAKARGLLPNLDESEEINACTVKIKADVDGASEDWLYLFKNETHNHPTEIEPFGGAATCIGGAIRDPLSGRAYVYQAMRVTGAGDPTQPTSATMQGKLPQRKLTVTAAEGYSSYGNQIGLATGQVSEIYHPGYMAKRMEIGAVVAAAPAAHVRRERPAAGDVVILVGGGTGRDGIGGATGSSKSHNTESLAKDGAEVQKGNALTERKLQRLFRRKDACRLIKRCNDFGAGGVSVAIGELADGLDIDLDLVPKKYEGLDGTELAISESQERMAVCVAPEDADTFCALAQAENLQATVVARVTESPRLTMRWRGATVVDISRNFLNSAGAPKSADVIVKKPDTETVKAPHTAASKDVETARKSTAADTNFSCRLHALVSDLNVASNKGLAERFDSTIGSGTVLAPFGGVTQLTPAQAMAALICTPGETSTCSGMAWGYDPYLSSRDPYAGAYAAVVESVAKMIASGFTKADLYLTFQEYFGAPRDEPCRWGVPLAALLGALDAQLDLGVFSIGGKDSMSGSFEQLDVPPTLVSFATGTGDARRVISPEFKGAGHELWFLAPDANPDGRPEARSLLQVFSYVEDLMGSALLLSCSAVGARGLAEVLFKACVGNQLGISFDENFCPDDPEKTAFFSPAFGSFVLELAPGAKMPKAPAKASLKRLGTTTKTYTLGQSDLSELQEAWERPLEGVFPYRSKGDGVAALGYCNGSSSVPKGSGRHTSLHIAKPRVFMPVFPGTNCEYDTERAFRRAGAEVKTYVLNNLSPQNIATSARDCAEALKSSQILMLPGGFSGGDEPDGSAKFICAFMREPHVAEALQELLGKDGLVLGICNGFQALIKLGLVPFGRITEPYPKGPTLTYNTIGRHQSRLVHTRISSTLSPWLAQCELGDIHTLAVSHGEGRFVCEETLLEDLIAKGQVAAQYCDADGKPSMDLSVNPNGSLLCVEAISSPDGRILGKMGHTERAGKHLYKNIPDIRIQPLFEGGVAYFA